MLEVFPEQPFEEPPVDVCGALPSQKGDAIHDTSQSHLTFGQPLVQQLDDIKSVLNAVPIGIGIAEDASCQHVTVNDALARILCITTDTNASLIGPEAAALPYQYVRDGVPVPVEELPLYRAAASGKYIEAEVDIEFDDGRCITVHQCARPLFNEQGKIQGSICTTTDITAQRREARATKFLVRAGEILVSSLSLNKTLSSLSRHVVPNFADLLIVDLQTESGVIERVATRYVDMSTKGFPLRSHSSLSLEDFPEHPAHEVLRTGIPFFADERDGPIPEKLTHRKDFLERLRSLCLTSIIIVPIEARGRTLGVMSLSTTNRRHSFDRRDLVTAAELARRTATAIDNARLLSAAERLREESERANRAKSDFLAAMSHELRTPLNAIAGYCQLLMMGLRGELNPAQREDLERIAQNQHHLLGLINSILNYTKLDAGVVQYDTTRVLAASALESIDPMIAPQVFSKGLQFQCDSTKQDLYIEADAEKLRQILLNLVFNAVKFTPTGGSVTIGGRLANGHVHLYVRDTGVGIAPEKLNRIFDPFVQVDRTLSTIHEGVGLGLAISRELARGMGGDILVRSEPGKGSTFTVMFPQA